MLSLLAGEQAKAGGWFARAERLVPDLDADSPVHGLLLVPAALEALGRGELTRAAQIGEEIVEVARRSGDRTVLALGLLGLGQSALVAGDTGRGLRLLDETMVAVAAGKTSPLTTGIVYCAVIESCMHVMDMRRAAEWTETLNSWCAAQPDLVPYRGQCLVHRAQVLQAYGDWPAAMAEALAARERLANPAHPALGLAWYQVGELYRLRGERAEAEHAYQAASRHGQQPEPGFALLRLAEGNVDAAAAAVRRMLAEGTGHPGGAAVLAAAVEVLLAAEDVAGASAAADKLAALAGADAPQLLCAAAGPGRRHGCARRGRPRRRAGRTAPLQRHRVRTRCRTRRPGPGCRSRWPAGRSATTTPPTWSWSPLAARCGGWAPGRSWPWPTGWPVSGAPPGCSATASTRCCGWWPPAGRTGRSRTRW